MDRPLTFLVLATTLALIPGPAVTLVMKYAVLAGRKALEVALGVFLADLVWMLASVIGVTALLVASQPAFDTLRLVGALYLIWLGIGLLRAHDITTLSTGRLAMRPRPMRDGLLCDLTNPKTALVFTSIIRQFIQPGSTTGPIAAGLAFTTIGFLPLLLYACVLDRGVTALRATGRRIMLRLSGIALIAFGGRLAAELR